MLPLLSLQLAVHLKGPPCGLRVQPATDMQPVMPVQLEGWFSAAGLRTWMDAVGNVHGRADGAHPGQPAVLLGSHYDTVRDAGKFDGALGIIVGLAALEALLVQVSRWTLGTSVCTCCMHSKEAAAHLLCGRRGTLCVVCIRLDSVSSCWLGLCNNNALLSQGRACLPAQAGSGCASGKRPVASCIC